MENFSALQQTNINSNTPSRQLHAVFHSLLLDDIKQDDATNTAHSKRLIALLKETNNNNISEYNMGEN